MNQWSKGPQALNLELLQQAHINHSKFFTTLNIKGLSGSISYMNHTPINAKWQYNKGIEGYIAISETNFSYI